MKRKFTLLLLLSSSLIGCGTPVAVRNLSQEQLKIQEAFEISLRTYFAAMERFAEAQMQVANLRILELTSEIQQRHKQLAVRKLEAATSSQGHQNILDEFAKNVQENFTASQDSKAQIAASLHKLKEKHQALQTSYMAIVEAQRKLNEYLQLEKADEVFVGQLVGMVGLNRERVKQVVAEIGTIVGDIEKVGERIQKAASQ